MLLAGLIAAAGMLFLLFKFGVRKIINYDIYVDLFVTVLLMFLLAGTFSGMMAALTAGTIVSVLLFFMKRTMRHESYGVIKTDKFPYRKFGWRTHDPKGMSS